MPLEFVDITRTTHTNLDSKKEDVLRDLWSSAEGAYKGNPECSLSQDWTGFTRFFLRREEAPEGYVWAGSELIEKKETTRPSIIDTKEWSRASKPKRDKAIQMWSKEKPKSNMHMSNV